MPAKAQDSYTDDDGEETKFDGYGRVELTEITLDDEDSERMSSCG